MKIAYITAKLPYGRGESFIIPEIEEIKKQGNEVLIFPCRAENEIFHKSALALGAITFNVKIIDLQLLLNLVFTFILSPLRTITIISMIVVQSRNIRILSKNLILAPKAFYYARIFKTLNIVHIHVHWASTPSTIAFIASYLTGIPWSFTAHRWDIHENNLLREKAKSATFIRAINQNGKNEIINIINEKSLNHKIFVIHMGVEIPSTTQRHPSSNGIFTLLCAANLVPVKGHKYLIEACNILQKNGTDFKCYIAGEGYLQNELIALVNKLQLNNHIHFLGKLPHDRLIKMFEEKAVDLVVLPSIVTTSGEKEGIPVTLMEAMAYNLPVISTSTGGIPELIKDAGVLVDAKNPTQLAKCINNFITNRDFYKRISESCREKVAEEYNITNIVNKILNKIRNVT